MFSDANVPYVGGRRIHDELQMVFSFSLTIHRLRLLSDAEIRKIVGAVLNEHGLGKN